MAESTESHEYRRARRSKGYESVSRDMLQRVDLSWEARGMLAFLLSLPPGFDPHGAEGMSRFGPVGVKGVKTIISELEDKGLLARVKARTRGTRSGWDWLWTWSDDPEDVKADATAWLAERNVSAGGTVGPQRGVPPTAAPTEQGLFSVSAGGAVSPPRGVPQSGSHKGLEVTKDPTEEINPPTPRAAGGARDARLGQFEDFWQAYPQRTGKGKAREAWSNAVLKRGADPGRIISAAARFAEAWSRADADRSFIPMPATWLNQDRYYDEDPRVKVREWRDQAPMQRAQAIQALKRTTPPGPPVRGQIEIEGGRRVLDA